MTTPDPDTQRGLYPKYRVLKIVQNEDPLTGKGVTLVPVTEETFVLKASDPYAPMALMAYANTCKFSYPQLAQDLEAMSKRWYDGQGK